MKTLLIILLLLATVGLFFHDKQQTADLAKAQDENAQLTQQLATYQASFNDLQAKMQKLTAQAAAAPASVFHPTTPVSGAPSLTGANPLDRPAFKDH